MKIGSWLGGLVVLAGVASSAQAADMPLFPQPVEVQPVEDLTWGTGWYLRGDLTASDDREPNVLGTLDEGTREWGYGAGIGAGYKFNDYFRADVTADYLSTQKKTNGQFTNNCDIDGGLTCTAKSNVRRFDGLANGYFDIVNWYGIVPYIGAGIGFAGIRTDGSITAFNDATDTSTRSKVSGVTDYHLAWAVMAGAAYHITPNLLLDVGYRYLDLGNYEAPGAFYAPGKHSPKIDLDSHEVRVGVRYMLY